MLVASRQKWQSEFSERAQGNGFLVEFGDRLATLIGCHAEIHQLIKRLADEGVGILRISSYLQEILNLSDRILVSRRSRIVEEFTAGKATQESIMYAAVH